MKNVRTDKMIENIIEDMLTYNLSKYQAVDKLRKIANRDLIKVENPQEFTISNLVTRGDSVVCELELSYTKIEDTLLQNGGKVLLDYIF